VRSVKCTKVVRCAHGRIFKKSVIRDNTGKKSRSDHVSTIVVGCGGLTSQELYSVKKTCENRKDRRVLL
jgi:hypothetical protein